MNTPQPSPPVFSYEEGNQYTKEFYYLGIGGTVREPVHEGKPTVEFNASPKPENWREIEAAILAHC